MSGWIVALALAALTLGGLILSGRCSRLALEVIAAMILAGLAGYAWTGSPDQAGDPVAERTSLR